MKPGDEMIVTGDVAGWIHNIGAGDHVNLIDKLDGAGYHSDYDTGWYVRVCECFCENRNHKNLTRDVADVDLESAIKPVTEADLAEVYKILGVRRDA